MTNEEIKNTQESLPTAQELNQDADFAKFIIISLIYLKFIYILYFWAGGEILYLEKCSSSVFSAGYQKSAYFCQTQSLDDCLDLN